jgi:glycosyltransferase involved in cell wall biosynthesis
MSTGPARREDRAGRPATPGGPRISVALCTLDGARFLEPQLDSFAAQTRLPDELVACDDGSSDGTVAILQAFARRAPFPVRIEQNPARLGSTRNFEKAIGLCSGELIATSDQDDVWLPEKLALGEAAFARDPRLGLVFSDAEVVDENLRPLGYRLWDAISFGPAARRDVRRGQAFPVLLRDWRVTGATMMFRSSYRGAVLPIPPCWVHDAWIALLVAAMAPVGLVERPTVKYRRHEGQQIGATRFTVRQLYEIASSMGPAYFRLNHERFRLAGERLHALADRLEDPGSLALVDGKVAHLERRLAISETPSRGRRILLAVDEWLHGRYRRYSPAFTHVLKDMFL